MPQQHSFVAAEIGLHARAAAVFVRAVNETGLPVTIRKPDGLPDAGLVAQVHDVIPPARIGGLLPQPPPVDLPGVDAKRSRRLVGMGELQFVLALQTGPDPIRPLGATQDRLARRAKSVPALGGPPGAIATRPAGVSLA